jgi:hypothetical protein
MYRVFPGGKAARGVTTTHPHLAPMSKKEQSYTSTPPLSLRSLFYGELYLYLYITKDKMYRINNTYAMHSLQTASNFMQQTLLS